jgi:hypothetical protein
VRVPGKAVVRTSTRSAAPAKAHAHVVARKAAAPVKKKHR